MYSTPCALLGDQRTGGSRRYRKGAIMIRMGRCDARSRSSRDAAGASLEIALFWYQTPPFFSAVLQKWSELPRE